MRTKGEKNGITNRYKETFRRNGHVHYLDCNVHSMSIHKCWHPSMYVVSHVPLVKDEKWP